MVEVSIRQDGELFFDGFQKPDSNIKTIVSSMSKLIWVSDRTERSSCLCMDIKRTSRMPSTSTKTKTHTHTHTYLEPHTYFNHYHSLLSNSPKKNQIEKQRYPYANLSMRGAQCFSAMRPLSFLLHFSTAF